MDEKENKAYIESKVHPILEVMVTDLLVKKPTDPIDFMINWLNTKGKEFQHQSLNHVTLKSLQADQSKKKNKKEDHSSEEEDDDFVDELVVAAAKKKDPKQRSSVSAEAFGAFNQKKAFVARTVPKNEEAKQRILKRMSQGFMFSALDEKEKDIVVNAMEEKKFKPGQWVIQQGEDGDYLYVVDQGTLDCFKRFTKDQKEPTYLKTYQPGESFGELALLYNAPRAASIQAKTDSILWGLDRETFNNIVKDAATKKRERYESVLGKVELLKTMDNYERSQIADALITVKCKAGEYVFKQGEEGDLFFMVQEGELSALKSENGGPEKEVYAYQQGGYFGELALLNNKPRQASIKCKTDSVLIALNRLSFKRLLGPMEDLLKRNQELYSKYNK